MNCLQRHLAASLIKTPPCYVLIYYQLWHKQSKLFTSAAGTWQTALTPAWIFLWHFYVSVCPPVCACAGAEHSRLGECAVCYWQLSPSPWAGEAACCVGRGYTCSGPVRPRCRCTSHLSPAPSCRSASPPPASGTEPAQNGKKNIEYICMDMHMDIQTAWWCQLLFIKNAWGQTQTFTLPACISSNLKSVAALYFQTNKFIHHLKVPCRVLWRKGSLNSFHIVISCAHSVTVS